LPGTRNRPVSVSHAAEQVVGCYDTLPLEVVDSASEPWQPPGSDGWDASVASRRPGGSAVALDLEQNGADTLQAMIAQLDEVERPSGPRCRLLESATEPWCSGRCGRPMPAVGHARVDVRGGRDQVTGLFIAAVKSPAESFQPARRRGTGSCRAVVSVNSLPGRGVGTTEMSVDAPAAPIALGGRRPR